jgi:hypothetical protein
MKNRLFIFGSVFLLLSSCSSIVSKIVVGKSNIYKDLKVFKNDKGQEIVFLPMVHIGKESYYKDCKIIIDSLRKDDFKVFYENIAYKHDLDSITKLNYDKKVRSILGHTPKLDAENKSLPKLYNKSNYIVQDYALMGITQGDTNLDLDKKAIIDSIETKYGKLSLSECDFNTQLYDEYNCKSENKKFLFALTNEFRDPYISAEILKLNEDKIVLVYGKMHWYFIYPKLIDNGFKLTKGKI